MMNSSENRPECPLPDGDHIFEVVNIQRTVDKKNRIVMTWYLKVAEGPHAGVTVQKRYYLVNPKVAEILKRDLAFLGVLAENKEELEAKKGQALGKRFLAAATVNEHGYQCYYPKKIIVGDTGDRTDSSPVSGW